MVQFKVSFSSEQLRVSGKMPGLLRQGTATAWLKEAARRQHTVQDLVDLCQECRDTKDFVVLPPIRNKSIILISNIQAAILELFFPGKPPIVLFQEEKQQPEKDPRHTLNKKKLLCLAAGCPIANLQNPDFNRDEFKGLLVQGFSTNIWMRLGGGTADLDLCKTI